MTSENAGAADGPGDTAAAATAQRNARDWPPISMSTSAWSAQVWPA